MAAPPAKTVRKLIESAYRKLGVFASGESIPSEEMADGLTAFQDMLAEIGPGSVPAVVTEELTLVVNQTSYTIGEDGSPDFDTVRPEEIVSAFVRETTIDYPVRIIDEAAYNDIWDKSTGGSRPEFLWYNPSAPNGVINIYRAPATADGLWITSLKPITDGAGLTDDVMLDLGLPRSYHNPLMYMLAVDLAPEHGIEPPLVVAVRADEGKRKIQSLAAARRHKAATCEFAYYPVNDDLIRYV